MERNRDMLNRNVFILSRGSVHSVFRICKACILPVRHLNGEKEEMSVFDGVCSDLSNYTLVHLCNILYVPSTWGVGDKKKKKKTTKKKAYPLCNIELLCITCVLYKGATKKI